MTHPANTGKYIIPHSFVTAKNPSFASTVKCFHGINSPSILSVRFNPCHLTVLLHYRDLLFNKRMPGFAVVGNNKDNPLLFFLLIEFARIGSGLKVM
ncbi:hypothetical protein HDF22_005640 [Mucilaginibacter lappiensis]|uniref:Uncharacterized protein n=1 Tax=Mucilaginibacter lappiensis TaxID=354630 RepID=A0A841JJY5_9SPHI|nr:hypothetical protein [Mucilaginibacter lappiensis]